MPILPFDPAEAAMADTRAAENEMAASRGPGAL